MGLFEKLDKEVCSFEKLDSVVSDIVHTEDKILDTAIRRCLTINNLKREDVILLTPNDRYNGKFYLIKKSDAVARVGEREDLSKAFCLGGFKLKPEIGEIIWQNY